jgi:hypothetical protein
MGCDIHMYAEVKINGVWHYYGPIEGQRRYGVFARMADVRNGGDIEPVSQPRGVPDDASFMTKFHADYWSDDGHSHSWLSAAEVAAIPEYFREEGKEYDDPSGRDWSIKFFGLIFSNTWEGFVKHPEYRRKGVEDARIVFWFDN